MVREISTKQGGCIRTLLKFGVVALVVLVLQNEPPRRGEAQHINKEVVTQAKAETVNVTPTPAPALPVVPPQPPTPTCDGEISKYGWNQSVAHNVMMVESSGNPNILNNNPSTGDYSVGCFQINLMGGNLLSKYRVAVSLGYTGQPTIEELEPWLKNAANNVAVAHKLWLGSGWSPWSFTTCKKVACY